MSEDVQAISQPVEHTIAIGVCGLHTRGCGAALELVIEDVDPVGQSIEVPLPSESPRRKNAAW